MPSIEKRLADLERANDPRADDWARERLAEKARAAEEFDWDRLHRDLNNGFTLNCRPDFDGATREEVLARATRWMNEVNNCVPPTDAKPGWTEAETAVEAERMTTKIMAMTREQWLACKRENQLTAGMTGKDDSR